MLLSNILKEFRISNKPDLVLNNDNYIIKNKELYYYVSNFRLVKSTSNSRNTSIKHKGGKKYADIYIGGSRFPLILEAKTILNKTKKSQKFQGETVSNEKLYVDPISCRSFQTNDLMKKINYISFENLDLNILNNELITKIISKARKRHLPNLVNKLESDRTRFTDLISFIENKNTNLSFFYDNTKYTVNEKIGQGGYGEIYTVNEDLSKVFKTYKLDEDAEFEIERMNILKSKFIGFEKYLITSSIAIRKKKNFKLCTVMPKATPWYDYQGSHFVIPYKKLFIQLIDCVLFLHKYNWIHCDIKPANIVVCFPNDIPTLKLIDFDLSRIHLGNKLVLFDKTDYPDIDIFFKPPLFYTLKTHRISVNNITVWLEDDKSNAISVKESIQILKKVRILCSDHLVKYDAKCPKCQRNNLCIQFIGIQNRYRYWSPSTCCIDKITDWYSVINTIKEILNYREEHVVNIQHLETYFRDNDVINREEIVKLIHQIEIRDS